MFGGISNIAGFFTASITIMGAVALMVANLARYMQASKYGIPVKAVSQATISDSAAVWFMLIRTIGFGVILPVFLLFTETRMPFFIIYVIIVFSIFFSQSATLIYKFPVKKEKVVNGKTYIVVIEHMYRFLAVFALVVAVAFTYFYGVFQNWFFGDNEYIANGFFGNIFFYLAVVILFVYVFIFIVKFNAGISTTLLGDKDSMIVDIDDTTYLIAMRNSHYHYILLPCELDTVVTRQYKNGSYSTRNYIRFKKGTFIIRDMSTTHGHIKRLEDYSQVDIGILKEQV